jgi:hypothetical protein
MFLMHNELQQEIIKICDDSSFWKTLEEDIWQNNSREAVSRTIVDLHNEKTINITKILTSSEKPENNYSYRSICQDTLPFLNDISISDLFKIILLFLEICKNLPHEWYEKYLRNHPDKVFAILSYLENNTENLYDLLAVTLNVISSFDIDKAQKKAFEYTNHPHLNFQLNGIFALGLFDYDGRPDLLNSTIDFWGNDFKKEIPPERSVILVRTCRFLQPKTADKRIVEYIRFSIKEKWNCVSKEILYIFWVNNKYLDIDTIKLILEYSLKPGMTDDLIDYLDYGVKEIFATRKDIAIKFIEDWLINKEDGGKAIKQLDSVFRLICSSPDIFSRFLTTFFASDFPSHHQAAAKIFEGIGDNQKIHLDIDLLNDLSKERIHFMMKKIIGYCLLHLQPRKTCSIFASFLKVKHNKKFIDNIFIGYYYNFLGINYGGTANDFISDMLKSKLNKREQQVLSEIKKLLDKYYKALNNLPDIPELHADIELRKIYKEAENRQFQEAHEKANANSPILSIFSTSVLLHGQSFFHENHIYQPKKPQEDEIELSGSSNLGHFEHRWEYARMFKFDSVGLDKCLMIMQQENFEDII